MKKIISLLIVLVMTMSTFVGCATGDSSPTTPTPFVTEVVTTADVAQTEPTTPTPEIVEPAKEYDAFDVFTYPGVEEIEGISYREASRMLIDNGYTESWLGHCTVHDSIRMGTMGDVIVGQVRYDENPDMLWNFRIEKSDALKNTTGIEPAPDIAVNNEDLYGGMYPNSERQVRAWMPTEATTSRLNADGQEILDCVIYYVASYYYPKTGNLYTIYSNSAVCTMNTTTWMIRGYPEANPGSAFANSEYNECLSCGPNEHENYLKQDWNKIVMDTFTVKANGKKLTYKCRYASSLDEWLHSEYNTDGWHRLFYRSGNENEGNCDAVSPEYGYEFCISGCKDEVYESHWIMNPVLMRNQSKRASNYDANREENYNPNEFERGSFYVVKNVPMHIYGFNMFNKYNQMLYEGGNGPMYRYSGWYVDYKMNTPLTIDGIGLREEDTEHMKFMLVPHYVPNSDNPLTYEKADGYPYGNDIEAIREAATELEVEFKPYAELPQFWSGYMNDILPDYGFRLVLNAKDIEGFEAGVAYDICITYDDEVVYWLFMPEFTN